VPQVYSPADPAVAAAVNVDLAAYIRYLPPQLIGIPYIFFAVALAFVFVIIVFV
jgi:hypothetical protein